MTTSVKLLCVSAAIACGAGFVSCQSTRTATPTDPVLAQSATTFDDTVKEVLEHRCIHCHHDSAINGGLNFQDRASVFASGGNGPFIVPGNPGKSKVWQAIFRPKTHPNTMPGDGWGLTQAQTKGFLEWIETGAYWPEGKAGKLKVRKYEIQLDDYL
jgi:hypothetical protein